MDGNQVLGSAGCWCHGGNVDSSEKYTFVVHWEMTENANNGT